MQRIDSPIPTCPSCGQNLRGLAPLPPALLLRCPECGTVTTVRRIAEREVHHRRSITHLLIWVTLVFIILAATIFSGAMARILH